MSLPVTVSLDAATQKEVDDVVAAGAGLAAAVKGFTLELGPNTLSAITGLTQALNALATDAASIGAAVNTVGADVANAPAAISDAIASGIKQVF